MPVNCTSQNTKEVRKKLWEPIFWTHMVGAEEKLSLFCYSKTTFVHNFDQFRFSLAQKHILLACALCSTRSVSIFTETHHCETVSRDQSDTFHQILMIWAAFNDCSFVFSPDRNRWRRHIMCALYSAPSRFQYSPEGIGWNRSRF